MRKTLELRLQYFERVLAHQEGESMTDYFMTLGRIKEVKFLLTQLND